jgi:hypothetical protein
LSVDIALSYGFEPEGWTMNPREKPVVARLSSGLVIRGTTLDFTPDRPGFRVTPEEGGRGVEVKVRDLKALFFTRVAGRAPPPGVGVYQTPRDHVTRPHRQSVRIKHWGN